MEISKRGEVINAANQENVDQCQEIGTNDYGVKKNEVWFKIGGRLFDINKNSRTKEEGYKDNAEKHKHT